jgi:hypothetical protein
MTSTLNLTALAASAGKAHGAIVEAVVRGSKQNGKGTVVSIEEALAQLGSSVKLPKRDFDKLKEIVALCANKHSNAEKLTQIRALDEALQRKPDSVHPLVLAISGVANDSANTNLTAKVPATNGSKSKGQDSKPVSNAAVVLADVAGAVLGAIAGAKQTKEIDVLIVCAIGGAMLASSTVGSGQPFPSIGARITVE